MTLAEFLIKLDHLPLDAEVIMTNYGPVTEDAEPYVTIDDVQYDGKRIVIS